MQRSRGSGPGVVVSKICYNTVIVLSDVLWDCCKPVSNCRDWDFSNSEFEVGLPAFQLPMFTKCDALPNGDVLDMFRNPFPLFLVGIPSIHSLAEAWAFWEPRTFRHLCIRSWLHHAHPFVAAAEETCHMQRSRGSGHGVVVSKNCYNTVIVLSVVLWDCCKPTNKCWDWASSNS